jgi:hypothetical protein
MHFALCVFNKWRNSFVQTVNGSFPFTHQDGDAIAVPFSTSNLNPDFPSKKF